MDKKLAVHFPWKGVALGMAILFGTALAALAFRTRTPVRVPVDEPAFEVSAGRVPRGASFPGLLGKAGLLRRENDAASAALAKTLKLEAIREGRNFEVGRSTDGAFAYFLYYESPKVRYRLTRGDVGFVAAKEELPVTRELYGISGTVKSSLWASMKESGVSEDLIFKFADVFAWQIDFLTEPRKGDRFRVVWERSVVEGKTISDRRILSAAYEGKECGRHFAVLFHAADGSDAYYDLEGKSMQKAFLRAPLQFRRISSRFSAHRMHPIYRIFRPHYGIDYAAPIGTPVVAIGDGKVVEAELKGANGRIVRVRHNATYESAYLHLSAFAKGVRNGATVKQGQVLGYVGMSGHATGPHLDFRIFVNGTPVDFLKLKLPPAASVPETARAEYGRMRKRMLALLGRVESDTRVAQSFSGTAPGLTIAR